jgi:copper chaperone CopZ
MHLTPVIVVLATAASLVACDGGGAASTAEAPKAVIPAAYTTTFSVKGMHCDGCAKTVAKKVKAVEGVADCTVDLQGERAIVGMDDAKRTQAVIDVVKKLGYEVEPIDESAPAAAPAAPSADPAAPAAAPAADPAAPAAEPAAPATTPAT